MSTICTICGNVHDNLQQAKRCQLQRRKTEILPDKKIQLIMWNTKRGFGRDE